MLSERRGRGKAMRYPFPDLLGLDVQRVHGLGGDYVVAAQ
jgi:hypothetical protein